MSEKSEPVKPPSGYNSDLYQQLCNSYRAIDDFRGKLLGFLPLASGAGIFLLLNDALGGSDKTPSKLNPDLLLPIGLFGLIVAFGLFMFEIYGIRKCTDLILTGIVLEDALGIKGQFKSRQNGVIKIGKYRLINEPFASGIIYPAVMAAWAYVAFMQKFPAQAGWIALAILALGFGASLLYILSLER